MVFLFMLLLWTHKSGPAIGPTGWVQPFLLLLLLHLSHEPKTARAWPLDGDWLRALLDREGDVLRPHSRGLIRRGRRWQPQFICSDHHPQGTPSLSHADNVNKDLRLRHTWRTLYN